MQYFKKVQGPLTIQLVSIKYQDSNILILYGKGKGKI